MLGAGHPSARPEAPHAEARQVIRTTLFDLTHELAGSLPRDADVVEALAKLLRTGRVRTCTGTRIVLQDGPADAGAFEGRGGSDAR